MRGLIAALEVPNHVGARPSTVVGATIERPRQVRGDGQSPGSESCSSGVDYEVEAAFGRAWMARAKMAGFVRSGA